MMNRRGFTMLEVIVAAAIGALLAGGTMVAFMMTSKMSMDASNKSEAAYLTQQTMERFRNKVACDESRWFDASCKSTMTGAWIDDPIPAGAAPSVAGFAANRQYKVEPADCDGDGTVGDCLKVVTKLSWQKPQ